MLIHPTALIDSKAQLASDVTVGPYSIIGPDVSIDAGTTVGAHVVIEGPTRIGKKNRIFPFASLGAAPQDKKYAGEPTALEIGDNNTIREFCTFNRGTVQDTGVTRIGNDNWIMAYVHIAHDCQIANQTILANNSSLAGHVHLDDFAILGGFTLVHQFCHIGAHVMTAVGTVVFKDIPPFVTASGYDAAPHGINSEGLKRRNFSSERIAVIKRAYKILYRSNLMLEEAKIALSEQRTTSTDIDLLLTFLSSSTRGIVR